MEVVVRLLGSSRSGLRAKRRSQRCDAREPGKGEFWQLDNFVNVLMLSDFDVTCRVTKNYDYDDFLYFDFYVLLFAGWQQ